MVKKFCFYATLLLLGLKAEAQTPNLQLTPLATGFSSITSLAHCNDDRLFVVQQRGRIRIVDINTGAVNSTDFLNLTSLVTQSGSERGLLGLAFHPQYQSNGYFFVSYTDNAGSSVIARYRVSESNPDVADPNSGQILLTFTQPFSNHNGGDIQFGKDGFLYFGSGDGGSAGDPQNFAQNNMSLLGKMLRIDVNDFSSSTYTVPPSNPFVGNASYRPEIWSTGLRNPWRFSFDRLNGDMWIGDVGQNAMEEINYQPASSAGGENYGWRCYEGTLPYQLSGCGAQSNYVFPVFFYNQSGNGCSVTGGFVYRGALYDYMYGRYFLTDYCSGRIWSFPADGSNNYQATIHGNFVANNYVAFGEDRYGELYLAERGRVMRVTVESCVPVAKILETGSLTICDGESTVLRAAFHPSLTYQWYKDNQLIDGATLAELTVTEPGEYKVDVTRDNCSNLSESVEVSFAPGVPLEFSIEMTSICIDQLSIELGASPSGGIFTGAGVSNGVFDPAQAGAGIHVITYSYSEPGFCNSQITDTVTVNPLPVLTIGNLAAIYCVDEAPVQLQVSPTGGVFSGASENGIFDPAAAGIGTHEIVYSFTDANGCAASVSISTEVDACLSFNDLNGNEFTIFPMPAADKFFIRFDKVPTNMTEFTLMDMNGKIYKPEVTNSGAVYQLQLNSNYASGVYLLEIKIEGQRFAKRLLISRN